MDSAALGLMLVKSTCCAVSTTLGSRHRVAEGNPAHWDETHSVLRKQTFILKHRRQAGALARDSRYNLHMHGLLHHFALCHVCFPEQLSSCASQGSRLKPCHLSAVAVLRAQITCVSRVGQCNDSQRVIELARSSVIWRMIRFVHACDVKPRTRWQHTAPDAAAAAAAHCAGLPVAVVRHRVPDRGGNGAVAAAIVRCVVPLQLAMNFGGGPV